MQQRTQQPAGTAEAQAAAAATETGTRGPMVKFHLPAATLSPTSADAHTSRKCCDYSILRDYLRNVRSATISRGIAKMPNPKVGPVSFPFQVTGWWYQEFSAGQKATPLAGINAAQTWLNDNIKPNTPVVFGNVDGQGTVRLFWYGSKSLIWPVEQ